ncbi:MAG: UDP-N-acetylmuramoyl-L-alanyl-D-glutamate--2,6-diaminopimelate ligase [Myxococcales bacterium]
MKLAALLVGLDGARVVGDAATEVCEVRDDSRAVRPGDLFVAVPGVAADGRKFVSDALARGATVIVEQTSFPAESAPARDVAVPPGVTVVTVPSSRHALAVIAANRFATGRALTLSAVTGTNGKTTTTYLMEAILGAAGIRAGVVGTITYRLTGGQSGLSRAAPLTTPGALALHALFAEMQAAGASDVVLEASSHALAQGRLDGCRFRVAGLTNLTQDHLDFHGSMDAYLDAKAILFERLLDPAGGVAVLPVDLAAGRAMRARVLAGGGGRVVLGIASTPGERTPGADVVVESATLSADGLRARLATPLGPLALASPLVGDYNLANIVLAVGMAIARGADAASIVAGVERLQGVPGRLERVSNGAGVLCVVDYAHTPDALERTQATVRPLVGAGGRLVTVFGCGGDRDRTKRPLMGRAAAAGSDLAIVTSDNPRGEDPQAIIDMIVEGLTPDNLPRLRTATAPTPTLATAHPTPRGFLVCPDRRVAIRTAVDLSRAGDVLLIAGKGHEDYQIVGKDRIHFDDREEAANAFAAKVGGLGGVSGA